MNKVITNVKVDVSGIKMTERERWFTLGELSEALNKGWLSEYLVQILGVLKINS